MNRDRFHDVFNETMREIYRASIPSADWDDLLANSPRNENGQILVPYEDYKISDQVLDEIVTRKTKEYRLREPWKSSLRTNVYLGPSPISIRAK